VSCNLFLSLGDYYYSIAPGDYYYSIAPGDYYYSIAPGDYYYSIAPGDYYYSIAPVNKLKVSGLVVVFISTQPYFNKHFLLEFINF
jgi:hypothetical protein